MRQACKVTLESLLQEMARAASWGRAGYNQGFHDLELDNRCKRASMPPGPSGDVRTRGDEKTEMSAVRRALNRRARGGVPTGFPKLGIIGNPCTTGRRRVRQHLKTGDVFMFATVTVTPSCTCFEHEGMASAVSCAANVHFRPIQRVAAVIRRSRLYFSS